MAVLLASGIVLSAAHGVWVLAKNAKKDGLLTAAISALYRTPAYQAAQVVSAVWAALPARPDTSSTKTSNASSNAIPHAPLAAFPIPTSAPPVFWATLYPKTHVLLTWIVILRRTA